MSTKHCKIEGCEDKHDSYGLCGKHRMRERRHGDVSKGRPSLGELLLRHIDVDPKGCWLWTAKITKGGYGSVSGKSLLAHRVSYATYKGAIPKGLVIDHLCRVKSCINPDHLEAVTQKENLRRRDIALGMATAKTHCPKGHEYNEVNTYVSPQNRRSCRTCNRMRRKLKENKKE